MYLQSLETPIHTHIYIYLYPYTNNKVTTMPYVALRSHVVVTRLDWRTWPISLSNKTQCGTTILDDCTSWGLLNAMVKIASVATSSSF